MVKFKFFICFLVSVMLFTSANAQVFLDDKEPVQEELKTIDTIVTLEEDGTNINDMLNINNYIYDTIDQVEKKYIQQMYVSAPKPTDDIKVNLGVKKTFVDGSWADFLRLIDSTRRNYFIQFSAAWCGPCKMMEHVVFNKAPIIDIATRYYYAKLIDIDDFDGVQITQDMHIKNLPTTIIFNCEGTELKRIEGFINEDMFLELLKKYK